MDRLVKSMKEVGAAIKEAEANDRPTQELYKQLKALQETYRKRPKESRYASN